MDQIGIAGIVGDVDRDRLAFPQAQQRAGNGSVVACGFDDFAGRDLQ